MRVKGHPSPGEDTRCSQEINKKQEGGIEGIKMAKDRRPTDSHHCPLPFVSLSLHVHCSLIYLFLVFAFG